MDSVLASLPELGVLAGASIVINEVWKRGQKNRKNIQQGDFVFDGKTEKSLLSIQSFEGKMDYDLHFTAQRLVMISKNKKNNHAVNYEDLKFIQIRRGSGGNLNFESTITGWRILWPDKEQLEQLSSLLPNISVLNGKLEIK